MKIKRTLTAGLFGGLIQQVSAQSANPGAIIANVLCTLAPDIIGLARLLAILMFIYGGARYAYGADDPGARKQGKSIAINGLIGFIIVAMSKTLIGVIAGTPVC